MEMYGKFIGSIFGGFSGSLFRPAHTAPGGFCCIYRFAVL